MKLLRSTTCALVAAGCALSLLSAPGFAQRGGEAAGLFQSMAGSWTGNGTITTNRGNSERIRCRATYVIAHAGNIQQSLRCASDSYNFDLASDITATGSAISGTWSESTRKVGGNISGRVSGGSIQARADGTVSALLNVATRGNDQVVTLESPGSEIAAINITMKRTK
jgi:hypothetical protein